MHYEKSLFYILQIIAGELRSLFAKPAVSFSFIFLLTALPILIVAQMVAFSFYNCVNVHLNTWLVVDVK